MQIANAAQVTAETMCKHCNQPIKKCGCKPGDRLSPYFHPHSGLHKCEPFRRGTKAEPRRGRPKKNGELTS